MDVSRCVQVRFVKEQQQRRERGTNGFDGAVAAMRIRLGMGLQQVRARLEVDEPYFDMAIIDGRPTIWGNCDMSNAETIEAWLVAFGRAAIDVDLSGVMFFDAAALRALLAVATCNPNMRVVRPSPSVQRVLDLTSTSGRLVDGTTFS